MPEADAIHTITVDDTHMARTFSTLWRLIGRGAVIDPASLKADPCPPISISTMFSQLVARQRSYRSLARHRAPALVMRSSFFCSLARQVSLGPTIR